MKANGWALGFTLGLVCEVSKNNLFAFSYHYSPEKELTGTVSYNGDSHISNLVLPLPDTLELLAHHLPCIMV